MAEPTKPDPKKPAGEMPIDAESDAPAATVEETDAQTPAEEAVADESAEPASEPTAETAADDADAQADAILAANASNATESSISADELEAAMKAFSAGETPAQTATGGSKVDEDAVAAAMMASLNAAASSDSAPVDFGAEPFIAPSFDAPLRGTQAGPLDLLDDVELDVTVELGRAEMYIEDVLRLGVGSVVELDKLAGDPVDIYVNSQLVARGEVLVLNDNFCVRVNDIVSPVPEGDTRK